MNAFMQQCVIPKYRISNLWPARWWVVITPAEQPILQHPNQLCNETKLLSSYPRKDVSSNHRGTTGDKIVASFQIRSTAAILRSLPDVFLQNVFIKIIFLVNDLPQSFLYPSNSPPALQIHRECTLWTAQLLLQLCSHGLLRECAQRRSRGHP